MTQPTVQTRRLVLRPFLITDAPVVQRLAGDARVADTTYSIPHPYEDGVAEAWISTHAPAFEAMENVVFAVTLRDNQQLLGTMGLKIDEAQQHGELGYWIGVPFWNNGYATEAAAAVIDYAFSGLGLQQITGWYLVRNPSSGQVMRKAGMHPVPEEHRTLEKDGVVEDLLSCSISAHEYAG